MTKNNKCIEVITNVDLYITRSGRLAFLKGMREHEMGGTAFSGYVFGRAQGKDVSRQLQWLPSGECIDSNDDGDQIVAKA